MNSKAKLLSSLTKFPLHNLHHYRTIAKVRLKWVKNRSLDHIIDVQTDIKAACLIKDAILRSPAGYLTSKSLLDSQKLLGLTVPTLRFIRRYPTLFEEYPHPKYPSLACFKLTQLGKMMQDKEIRVFEECEGDVVERLCRLLMMTRNKLKLNEKSIGGSIDDNNAISGYREFKRGKAALEFPMSFPRGYGAQKKVKAWMDEFQRLPYISPYEDSRGIDTNSELMEKRVVGVLHELLSLTIYKKTKRNYLRSLREELNLPHKFTHWLIHILARHRDKLHYVMRTGLIYRSKAADMLPHLDSLVENVEDHAGEEESDEEEIIVDDEYNDSEAETGSDED
ncbi:UNVERIFIED_CONTAM: protein WHAT'S THIS FACTOR 9, mitochondrial [Sesamum calycinum]|uniref:Protein WHAT'S THIS FACTOR 9, mitochondrial n=1 Tax=Sesamum calycinum TaxID=2727403 RepID=A0AAW2N4Y3_9LAMI